MTKKKATRRKAPAKKKTARKKTATRKAATSKAVPEEKEPTPRERFEDAITLFEEAAEKFRLAMFALEDGVDVLDDIDGERRRNYIDFVNTAANVAGGRLEALRDESKAILLQEAGPAVEVPTVSVHIPSGVPQGAPGGPTLVLDDLENTRAVVTTAISLIRATEVSVEHASKAVPVWNWLNSTLRAVDKDIDIVKARLSEAVGEADGSAEAK